MRLEDIDKEFLSAEETAGVFGMSLRATYEAIRVGRIPSVRVGRRVLVPRRAIEDMRTPA